MTMLSTNPGHSPITKGKKTMAKKKNAVADSAINDELVLDLCEEIKLYLFNIIFRVIVIRNAEPHVILGCPT